MKKVLYALAAVAAAASTTPVAAQLPVPLSIEGRAGAAFPVGDFADGLETGLSLSASAAVGVTPGFGIYGAYNHTTFNADGGGGGLVDRGFSVGATASLAGLTPRVTPYLGAGLVMHELELDVDDGDDPDVGETDLGFEVGAGLAVQLAPNVRLTPALGYRRYGAEIPALVGTVEGDVSYLTLGVGLNIGF